MNLKIVNGVMQYIIHTEKGKYYCIYKPNKRIEQENFAERLVKNLE